MLVTMSDKELSRINVIQSVVEKRMRRRDAAHQLALTERQTRRGQPENRLVKELHLRAISTPEVANAFAEEFMFSLPLFLGSRSIKIMVLSIILRRHIV